jgi:ADP-heptose:LPS heptosyltransferase
MLTRNRRDPSIERILVFRTGQLGDMIAALPSLHAIRAKWPKAHLTLLCDIHPGQSYVLGSDIFRNAGLFDSFELYEVLSPSVSMVARALTKLRLLFRLRRQHFRTLFYLAPTLRSQQQIERDRRFFRLAGIQTFHGMKDFPAVPVKHQGLPLESLGHEADLLLARLTKSGISIPKLNQGSIDLGLGEEENKAVDRWLKDLPTDGGRSWIGIGPTSKMPAKRWPIERFDEVVRELIKQYDVWPVVFGGAEEKVIGDRLLESWGRGYNAAGALGVREAAAALQRCDLFLGNDSGAMHLAACAKVPCVAIFSSRDWPGAWYPYNVTSRVFRSEIECEGCYLVECIERQNECLKRISVGEVLAACGEVLAEASSKGLRAKGGTTRQHDHRTTNRGRTS